MNRELAHRQAQDLTRGQRYVVVCSVVGPINRCTRCELRTLYRLHILQSKITETLEVPLEQASSGLSSTVA